VTAKKKRPVNKRAIGIRLDKKILELLAEASATSGVSRTEIIEECVRAYAAEYVKYTFEKRKLAFEGYLKASKGKKK